MWSPDWEKWGRDRGTNETINPVMLGHMRPSVPTLKSKQDGFHIVVFSSVVLLLLWMEGNQRSRSVCQQVVVSGCIFCLVEVESRRKPYQHDTCVCLCVSVRPRGHMFLVCAPIFCVHNLWVFTYIEIFPVWLECQGCSCFRRQSCLSRKGSALLLSSVMLRFYSLVS